jgi:quinol monooxygenase YgiN
MLEYIGLPEPKRKLRTMMKIPEMKIPLAISCGRASIILAGHKSLTSSVSRGIFMIRVVAILTTKPGRRDDFIALFKANIPAVLEEKGCTEYMPVVDAEGSGAKMGSDAVVVIETWEDMAALEAHRVAPHMVAFGSAAKDMLAGRVIHVLSPA